MSLAAGSVSVDGTGLVSGSGYAADLYQIEVDASSLPVLLDGTGPAAAAAAQVGHPFTEAAVLAFRQRTAAKCNALAAAHVALVATGSVVVPPGDAGGTFPVT